jgi:hypothetical protein
MKTIFLHLIIIQLPSVFRSLICVLVRKSVLQYLTRVWQLYKVHRRESSPGAKRPAGKNDGSTQTCSEVKNDWSYAFTPTYVFMACAYMYVYIYIKAVPLQAWSDPKGSRKSRFPDFMTTAQDGGKVVSLTHRPSLHPGNTPGTHFC